MGSTWLSVKSECSSRGTCTCRCWRTSSRACLASSASYTPSLCFFFSSRRRHTRYWRDWSSDVCSSDLGFAEAILTTDTRTKEVAVGVEIGGKIVTVGGTAKGSGMIHPNMGTMLAFLTTDAAVEERCLHEALRAATGRTFNRVSVDGDTSPSDMAIILANGAAGGETITLDSPDYPNFAEAIEAVARGLAKEIARDGEGATRLVEVVVEGARDESSAAALAKSVVGSSLVKAAVFGEDANWGRVLTAMGYSGVTFDPDGVGLWFGPVKVFEIGRASCRERV